MKRRLLDMILAMRPPRALVVGDVMLDRYVDGGVVRISPEAPTQVMDITCEREVLGGAANVAANVAALGGKAALVGVVGADGEAERVRALLKKWGIPASGLVKDPSRPTTVKTRFVSLRQQMLRVDREDRRDVSAAVAEAMLARVEKALPGAGGVIISDYGKGALPPRLLKKIFALARKAGKPALVDPKGDGYERYKGATIITPNKSEAAAATGMRIETEADYDKAARRLFGVTGAESLFITRGAEGMTVFKPGGERTHLPAEAREVFDVTGAGDTVIAAIGVMLFSGHGLEDAARVANAAAGVEVGHVGAWAVTREEVLETLRHDGGGGKGKDMTRAQAAAFARKLRAQGRKVVFTNGCFDLLHAGHIKLLQSARALGGALIVGLNTDESIRRLKGAHRPVLGEEDRVDILSALHCVDAVVLFGEDTPSRLIEAVRPDILVKGGDYTPEAVVGRGVVEKAGGRVEIIPVAPGRSTTGIIEKILKKYAGE